MPQRRVTASIIVRVVVGEAGRRIVIHDLRSREIREFRSWAAALRYARRMTDEGGLR